MISRRVFAVALVLAGCAGVDDGFARREIASEIAGLIVSRDRLGRAVPDADARIARTREAMTDAFSDGYDTGELNTLRRLYASPSGDSLIALAWAEAAGQPKPAISAAHHDELSAFLRSDLGRRSTESLRRVLPTAFAAM